MKTSGLEQFKNVVDKLVSVPEEECACYVPPAYAAVLVVLMVFPLVQAVRAGNEITAPVRGVYRLGNWLAEKL